MKMRNFRTYLGEVWRRSCSRSSVPTPLFWWINVELDSRTKEKKMPRIMVTYARERKECKRLDLASVICSLTDTPDLEFIGEAASKLLFGPGDMIRVRPVVGGPDMTIEVL